MTGLGGNVKETISAETEREVATQYLTGGLFTRNLYPREGLDTANTRSNKKLSYG